MSRAPVLVLFVCRHCAHEVGAHPAAQVWCVRKGEHPPRAGPVLMLPKDQIRDQETHR